MDSSGRPVRYTGAGLGVFALKSWAPLREPGQPVTAASVSSVCDKQSVNGAHSVKSVNTARSSVVCSEQAQPLQQQQQQCYEAQSSALFSMHVPANNIGNGYENSNAVKPRELFI